MQLSGGLTMNRVLFKRIRQRENGHPELIVCKSGFIINPLYPFLGASPNGAVYDPSLSDEPYGFLEIQCPYSQRNVTPIEACDSPRFCCCTTIIGSKPISIYVKNTPTSAKYRVKWGLVNNPGVILLYTLPKELKHNASSLTMRFGIKSYYPSWWKFIWTVLR